MKNNKVRIVIASVLVLVAGFILATKAFKRSETERLGSAMESDFKKFVPDYAPKMGAENPKVYLVEFLDPECESCREFYPFVKMILNDYKDSVQLVIRYAPFHPNSKFAIRILEAARKQGKYWETLEVLFRYQPQWGGHHNPQPELVWNYLPEAGVNVEQIKKDLNNPDTEVMIEYEMKDVQELGVRATPEFFVNGRPLQTFSYEALRALVESEVNRK